MSNKIVILSAGVATEERDPALREGRGKDLQIATASVMLIGYFIYGKD